jgi:ActR/RegA family two-component response regulator
MDSVEDSVAAKVTAIDLATERTRLAVLLRMDNECADLMNESQVARVHALIPQLLEIDPETRIVVLTGYANISTAVEAIKLGAIYYLSKPVSTDEIIAAFHKQEGNPKTPVGTETLKLGMAEREHIVTALERNRRNVSATARELGMHRRTLQRKLDKLRI